jgi:16S rRNA (guanine527-N7)-methyltransferase
MNPRAQLVAGAASLGVVLAEHAIDLLLRYGELLQQWNDHINLTAIRDVASVVSKHFVDSLAVVPHVPASAKTLVDVGSGPGFPGAVIAVARPALSITLVESNHKKAAFLQTLRRELPLTNVSVSAYRVDAVQTKFDVAVSRATFDLSAWLTLGSRLVTAGGVVLGMEGQAIPDLPPGAARHPYCIDGASRSIIVLPVPREPP